MANAPTKPTTPVKNESSSASGAFATLTIPICIAVAVLIYMFILGDGSHYKGGDPEMMLTLAITSVSSTKVVLSYLSSCRTY
jgi:hypothetical protein